MKASEATKSLKINIEIEMATGKWIIVKKLWVEMNIYSKLINDLKASLPDGLAGQNNAKIQKKCRQYLKFALYSFLLLALKMICKLQILFIHLPKTSPKMVYMLIPIVPLNKKS